MDGDDLGASEQEQNARQVCLVDHMKLEFDGSVLQNGLVLGDVDGDGEVELVVGSVEGHVFVYKYSQLIAKCENLGTIVAIFVEDFLQQEKNVILVLTGEGKCFLFDMGDSEEGLKLESEAEVDNDDKVWTLEPYHIFNIPWNVTCGIMLDVTGDGYKDLILAQQDGGARKTTVSALCKQLDGRAKDLQLVAQWSFHGFAVSMSYCNIDDSKGEELILVGLQFGGFVTLDLEGGVMQHSLSDQYGVRMRAEGIGETILSSRNNYGAKLSSSSANHPIPPTVPSASSFESKSIVVSKPTVVLGTINNNNDNVYITLCFGDRLRVEQLHIEGHGEGIENELFWQEQQSRKLFALQAVDITNDGNLEIISCAWDGLTSVYDLENNVVRFQFENRVQGFLAGNYTHSPGQTEPCFVYVTLGMGIYVYTDVRKAIPAVSAETLLDVLPYHEDLHLFFEKLEKLFSNDETKAKMLREIADLNDGIRTIAYYAKVLNKILYHK